MSVAPVFSCVSGRLFHRPVAHGRLFERSVALLGHRAAVMEGGAASFFCPCPSISIPLSVVGECIDDENREELLLHSPSLSTTVGVTLTELEASLDRFQRTPKVELAEEITASCVMSAVSLAVQTRSAFLKALVVSAKRRSMTLAGMMNLLQVGTRFAQERQIAPTFPYHCGRDHAVQQWFDVSDEACSQFGVDLQHGVKILTSEGVGVCVGVAVNPSSNVPALYWQPLGSPAARIAPLFHSLGRVVVGHVRLEPNGPSPHSEVCIPEPLERYLNPGPMQWDTTTWLNKGLFGVCAGQEIAGGLRSLGVGLHATWGMLDLHCSTVDGSTVAYIDV